MGTLTVVKFPTPAGAQEALDTLKSLQTQGFIRLHDAAIVSWPEDRKKPKTEQLTNMAAAGALNGAFWGMLFGLIFFVPFLGAAIGAGFGALAGRFTNVGIDDNFIKQVREQVTQGTSALFLLTTSGVVDRIAEHFKGVEFEIVSTNLSREQEEELKAAFADE